jgi:hypothetical protein
MKPILVDSWWSNLEVKNFKWIFKSGPLLKCGSFILLWDRCLLNSRYNGVSQDHLSRTE